MSSGYAGDVSPNQAWEMLVAEPAAALVDCRTEPEFAFVGLCDLSALGKAPAAIPWQRWPEMDLNPDFTDAVRTAQPDPAAPVLFICRSGARSRAAAIAVTAAGYARCWNIAGGFEGDCDENSRRGGVNGWKCAGLPWRQT